jgi:hypothetical protein
VSGEITGGGSFRAPLSERQVAAMCATISKKEEK